MDDAELEVTCLDVTLEVTDIVLRRSVIQLYRPWLAVRKGDVFEEPGSVFVVVRGIDDLFDESKPLRRLVDQGCDVVNAAVDSGEHAVLSDLEFEVAGYLELDVGREDTVPAFHVPVGL